MNKCKLLTREETLDIVGEKYPYPGYKIKRVINWGTYKHCGYKTHDYIVGYRRCNCGKPCCKNGSKYNYTINIKICRCCGILINYDWY